MKPKNQKKELEMAKPLKLQFAQERSQFKALLLSNPNYFGNLMDSPFSPVFEIKSNTFYEQIGCVGFQPQFDRLEAVVFINQPSGYGGNVCSPGTPEYVRFYLSCDKGTTWEDVGLTSFRAYDIPEGTKAKDRLEYAVSLNIDDKTKEKLCYVENLCYVRAILSWSVPPPPNDPEYSPVWGDIHNTHIQIDALKYIILVDLLKEAKIKLPKNIATSIDLKQALTVPKPASLGLKQLAKLYEGKGVEAHRLLLPEIHKLSNQPDSIAELLALPGFKGLFPELQIDPEGLVGNLYPQKSSTRYEELECVGLDPNLNTLVGVIRVKRPNGYLGGLCSAGSKEYVTFWADFNDNGFYETYLGTTSVNVYDIKSIPKEGLEYAVFLPVNFDQYRQHCLLGPKVVKIRAILSWQVPPPNWNPNYIPVWGNREETIVHIKPGVKLLPGVHKPFIETVGNMSVDDIDLLTGLAHGPALLAGFEANQSPFSGEVIITGHIAYPGDISSGAPQLEYKVEVSNDWGASWNTVNNTFKLRLAQLMNGNWTLLPPFDQSAIGGWYKYQEDLTGVGGNRQIHPVGNVLARWNTGGLSGIYLIKITARHPVTMLTWISNVVTVKLDPEGPKTSIDIISGGGSCADFMIGNTISGNYAVEDDHFGVLTLRVLPTTIDGTPSGGSFTSPLPLPASAITMPLKRTFSGGVPTTGEAGSWSLDTSGMRKCGYVIELHAHDRTIVNSGSIGRSSRDLVGFCLRESEEG